jgi:hypothetical protein
VVRAVGVPPWWLRAPRAPFSRVGDVNDSPGALSIATAALVLALLATTAAISLRRGRRDLAAAALIALALMGALLLVTASTPNTQNLFAVIAYTIWWAAPAGMFVWLVLGYAAVVAIAAGRRREFDALRGRVPGAAGRVPVAAVAGLAAAVAVGVLVAVEERPDRLEKAFHPAGTIIDRVRGSAQAGHTVLIAGSPTEMGENLLGSVAYALRRSGVPFVVESLPGIGTRYSPASHPHDSTLTVEERRPGVGALPVPAPAANAREIARVTLSGVPADAPPDQRGTRPVVVTLFPPP